MIIVTEMIPYERRYDDKNFQAFLELGITAIFICFFGGFVSTCGACDGSVLALFFFCFEEGRELFSLFVDMCDITGLYAIGAERKGFLRVGMLGQMVLSVLGVILFVQFFSSANVSLVSAAHNNWHLHAVFSLQSYCDCLAFHSGGPNERQMCGSFLQRYEWERLVLMSCPWLCVVTSYMCEVI